MRHQLAIRLAALALALLAIARWLDGGPGADQGQRRQQAAASGRKQIDLPRHNYRVLNRAPGRLEVWRMWLEVWFSAWKFAAVGA